MSSTEVLRVIIEESVVECLNGPVSLETVAESIVDLWLIFVVDSMLPPVELLAIAKVLIEDWLNCSVVEIKLDSRVVSSLFVVGANVEDSVVAKPSVKVLDSEVEDSLISLVKSIVEFSVDTSFVVGLGSLNFFVVESVKIKVGSGLASSLFEVVANDEAVEKASVEDFWVDICVIYWLVAGKRVVWELIKSFVVISVSLVVVSFVRIFVVNVNSSLEIIVEILVNSSLLVKVEASVVEIDSFIVSVVVEISDSVLDFSGKFLTLVDSNVEIIFFVIDSEEETLL